MISRFECGWHNVSNRAVKPDAVVENFDVFEDRVFGFASDGERPTVHELDLQRVPKAFDHRVILAISTSTHAGCDAILVERMAIGCARVLASTIAVMDQACAG
jgi:hypothetical protein